MKSLYDILGINKHSSREEIIKAYYKKAKFCHPDNGGSKEDFLELNKAYTILSNPDRRSEYDKYGTIEESDSIDDLAVETITAYILAFINQLGVNLINTDIITSMVNRFNELIGEETSFKSEMFKKKLVLNEAKSRVIKLNDCIDYFSSIIDTEISSIDKSIESITKQINIYLKCLDILGNYAFRQDT